MNPQQQQRAIAKATSACWLALPAINTQYTTTELRAALQAYHGALTNLRAMAHELHSTDLLLTVHALEHEGGLIFGALGQSAKGGLVSV